jgi:hypothetical protein
MSLALHKSNFVQGEVCPDCSGKIQMNFRRLLCCILGHTYFTFFEKDGLYWSDDECGGAYNRKCGFCDHDWADTPEGALTLAHSVANDPRLQKKVSIQ